MTRLTGRIAAALLVGSGAVLALPMSPVFAAGCGATITVDDGPQLSSSNVSVPVGDCVTFANKASTPIRVDIGPYHSKSVGAGKSATYPATATGSHQGTVSQYPLTAVNQAPVTVTVTSPPSSSPAPTPTHTTSTTHHGGGNGSGGSPTGPDVAPKPKGHHGHGKKSGAGAGPSPTVSLPPIPPLSTTSARPDGGANPLVAPGQTLTPTPLASAGTGPSQSPAAAAVHPASSDGPSRGLPAAIAAVLILGGAGGLARVLRSSAVDGGRDRRRRS